MSLCADFIICLMIKIIYKNPLKLPPDADIVHKSIYGTLYH